MKPLEEPLESLRRLLQEARQKIDRPIEIILIGGAAALLSEAINRITDDIDILASKRTVAALQRAGALKFPIQPVADSFLCLHPDHRKSCKYVRELSFPPISKLSRFQQVDVEDIEAILTNERIDRKTLVRRYATARAYYTNPKDTDFNLRLLIRKVYGEEFDPQKDLPKPRGKP